MSLAHNIHKSKRTTDIQILQDITFETMLLSNNTLNGLKESGFFKPSPIQLHGIPLGKCGFDLILEAKSGTGKTAVFTIIALEKLNLNIGLQVIILAPTREIAAQICDVFKQIGCKYDGLCVEVVMGGLPVQDDINKFKNKKVHILVGSPGRLKHLVHDKHIDTNSVRLLILDEADRLMEKSFLTDIKYIHFSLPSQKQVILSSATYPENSKELVDQFVSSAQHICPNSNCILLGVAQKITYVKKNTNIVKQTEIRFIELLKILTKKQFKQCLVFCNYQARVGEVHKMLTKAKWPAEQLYGKQEQSDRLGAIKTLQEYKCRLLISTDLAARGIDASNVDLVINFEPPFEWQTYLHRIGRAGRYGSYGMAVTILSEGVETNKFLNLLETLNLSINLTPLWDEDTTGDNLINRQIVEPVIAEYSPISIIKDDNNYTELWNIICENKAILEKNQNAESFENLLKSFKELEINDIKSFSDLLKSFNNNNLPDLNGNCNCQYKYVNVPNITVKDYIKRLNSVKESILNNSDRNERKSNFKEQIYKICTDNEKLSCTEISSDAEIEIIKNEHIYGNPAAPVYDIDDNKNIFPNNNIKNTENTSKESDIEENHNPEVFKLELPVAFTSLKNQPRFFKNNSSNNKVFNQRKEKICYNSDNYAKTIKENVLNTSDSELNVTNSKLRQKSIKDDIKITNIPKHCYENQVSCAGISKDYYECSEKSVTNSYINWYSQLKLKVKEIELAIYIDELGKI